MTIISQSNDAHLIVPLNIELLAKLSNKAHESGKDILTHVHSILRESVAPEPKQGPGSEEEAS
jgi:hypothetical protein